MITKCSIPQRSGYMAAQKMNYSNIQKANQSDSFKKAGVVPSFKGKNEYNKGMGSINVYGENVSGNVKTGMGEIRINNSTINGNVNTGMGEVNVTNSSITESVKSAMGNITLIKAKVDDSVKTDSGNIHISDKTTIGGEVKIDNGNIKVDDSILKGKVKADMGNISFSNVKQFGDVINENGNINFVNTTRTGDTITSLGNIDLRGLKEKAVNSGDLQVKIGDITLDNAEQTGDLDVLKGDIGVSNSTITGDIEIKKPGYYINGEFHNNKMSLNNTVVDGTVKVFPKTENFELSGENFIKNLLFKEIPEVGTQKDISNETTKEFIFGSKTNIVNVFGHNNPVYQDISANNIANENISGESFEEMLERLIKKSITQINDSDGDNVAGKVIQTHTGTGKNIPGDKIIQPENIEQEIKQTIHEITLPKGTTISEILSDGKVKVNLILEEGAKIIKEALPEGINIIKKLI